MEKLRLHKALAAARAALTAPTPAAPVSTLEALTERERDICHLAAKGMPNEAIATRLYISKDTLKTHVKHIRAKLALEPAADLRTASRRMLDENCAETGVIEG